MRIFVSIALAFFALCSAAQAQSGCTGQTSSGYICGNSSASTGVPGLVSGPSLFNQTFGSTPGTVLNRTTSWGATSQPTLGANGGTGGAITLNGATSGSVTIGAKAAAGTSTVFNLPVTNGSLNNVLITDGAGNTSWVSAGSGTVSSVGLSMPGIFTVTNSPVVSTGTLTATLNTQSANLIWAGPSTGAASAPTFRSLVGADLPNPSASTLGGVQSLAAVTSQWIRQISTSGVPTASQPAFSDISGVVASTQLPNPTATTLGGIESYAAVSNQWINTISTSGVPSSSQPGFSNLSGQASLAQLPGIGSNTVLSNTTGGTSTPLANSLSSIIDNSMGSAQGDVLYRNAAGWVVLPPGTGGQVFTSGGAATNPSWTSVTGTGTVTSIATNNGITGGTITSSGTIALANITTGNVMANVSGSTTYPTPTIPSAVLDVIGSTEGSVLYRGASTWLALTPGSNGQYLQTTGAGSTPQWANVSIASPIWWQGMINESPNPATTPYSGATGFLQTNGFGTTIPTGSSITAGLNEVIAYGTQWGQPIRISAGGYASSPIASAVYTSATGNLALTFAVAPFGATPNATNIGAGVNITGMTPSSLNLPGTIASFASAGTVVNVTVTSGLGALSPSGGYLNSNLSYFGTTDTVKITPTSLQSIDISNTTINSAFANAHPGMLFDSSENSHFSMNTSQIVYTAGTGCAIVDSPGTLLPTSQDNYVTSSLNDRYFNSIVGGAGSSCLYEDDLTHMTTALGQGTGIGTMTIKELNGNGTAYGNLVTDPPNQVAGSNPYFLFNVRQYLGLHGMTVAGVQVGQTGANQAFLKDNIWTVFALNNGTVGTPLPDMFNTYESGSIINAACPNAQFITNCVHFRAGATGNFAFVMDAAGASNAINDQGTDNMTFYKGSIEISGCPAPQPTYLCFTGINAPINSNLVLNATTNGQNIVFENQYIANYEMSATSLFPISSLSLGQAANPWGSLYVNLSSASTTSAVCFNTSTKIFSYNGTVGTCTTSDERLKNIDHRIDNALDRLLQIDGFNFTWKDSAYGTGPQIGVGAQTVERVFPELVSTGSDGIKSVDYQRLTAPIIEAMRELKADNDNLRKCINSWKCRLFGTN